MHRVTVKLDQESKEILDHYGKQESVSAGETIRRGLKRLKPDLKKSKEAAHSSSKLLATSPAGNCQRHLRRNYYIMRRKSFQALSNF